LPKSLAVARVGFIAWKWFTEGTKSVAVVLGNHPCSVRRIAFNPMRAKLVAKIE
jgi:hypothetical protein